jgi:hypothetical protein
LTGLRGASNGQGRGDQRDVYPQRSALDTIDSIKKNVSAASIDDEID